MKYSYLSILVLLFTSNELHANGAEANIYNIDKLQSLSLNELLNLEVVSASRKSQKILDAPANITVVSANTIEQRGYENLVEVLKDVPGFDFATGESNAGEYTTHSINRGIGGSPGNVQLLILVDGIVQNHIAFNWSQPWDNQQIFVDLKRIEIIQGPGSATYGANAYSGIIHFITAQSDNEIGDQFLSTMGENNARSNSFIVDHQFSELYLQASGRLYETDGDSGLDRADPAGYFSSLPWPTHITYNYDEQGNFISESPNPFAGTNQQLGYNNQSKEWALRSKAIWRPKQTVKNGFTQFTLGMSLWDQKQGLGNYITGFEYQTRASSYKKHHSAQSFNIDSDYNINSNISLINKLWYRQNKQLPDTGFQYSYRFVDLVKSYHSVSSQIGFEQQLEWQINPKQNLLFGYRLQSSDKMEQVVSLGAYQDINNQGTHSSWLQALMGNSLNQYEYAQVNKVDEKAIYIQYQNTFTTNIDYTLGLRHDISDEHDSTTNPRIALTYNADEYIEKADWRIKFLYGEAFREPSIFELNDEFRGNHDLQPEKIKTYEIVSQLASNSDDFDASLKASVFFSQQTDIITLKIDNSDSGSGYMNRDHTETYGFSLDSQWRPSHSLSLYLNYQYTDGKHACHNNPLAHIAKNKINWGLNYLTLNDKLNINLRFNHALDRQAPEINSYFTKNVPNYHVANLLVSYKNFNIGELTLTPSIEIKNLFDEKYLGVGRQDGSSDISRYDPQNNANPLGFIPPYHPQPGRVIEAKIRVKF